MKTTMDLVDSFGTTDLIQHGESERDRSFAVVNEEKNYIPTGLKEMFSVKTSSSEIPASIFVTARGATGKSAFADFASRAIGAPLWRTDIDSALGAFSLEHKLTRYVQKVDVQREIKTLQNPIVIVDALDEAEVRVSAQSWNEFKDSLVQFARLGIRFLICGRDLASFDVMARFEEDQLTFTSYELQTFDLEQRRQFIDSSYQAQEHSTPISSSHYQNARDAVLQNLTFDVGGDLEDEFAGYAPVLQAVATQLSGENNLSARVSRDKTSDIRQVLSEIRNIVETILDREQQKFQHTAASEGFGDSDPEGIYGHREQAELLLYKVGLLPEAHVPKSITEDKLDRYVEMRDRQAEDHPFLSQYSRYEWASRVFEGYCLATLHDEIVSRRKFFNAASKNPFFAVLSAQNKNLSVDSWGLSALHASLLAFSTSVQVGDSGVADQSCRGQITRTDSGYEYSGEMVYNSRNQPTVMLVEKASLTSDSASLIYRGPLQRLVINSPEAYVGLDPADRAPFLGPGLVVDAEEFEFLAREVKLSTIQGADDFNLLVIADHFESPFPKMLSEFEKAEATVSLLPRTSQPSDEIQPYPWGQFLKPGVLSNSAMDVAGISIYKTLRLIEGLRILSVRYSASGMTLMGFGAKAGLPRGREDSAKIISILEKHGLLKVEGDGVKGLENELLPLFETPFSRSKKTRVSYGDLNEQQKTMWAKLMVEIASVLEKR